MFAVQDVLGVLEKRDEGLLAAVAQLLGGNADVKTSTPKNCFPAGKFQSSGLIFVLRSGIGSSICGSSVLIVVLALQADVVRRGADTKMDSQCCSLKV